MKYVLFILAGGLGTQTAVFLTARALVERHANTTADAIRRAHTPARPAERSKELTR